MHSYPAEIKINMSQRTERMKSVVPVFLLIKRHQFGNNQQKIMLTTVSLLNNARVVSLYSMCVEVRCCMEVFEGTS